MSEQQPRDDREAELLELIGDLLTGTATVEQRARLDELLSADAEARATYRRYVNLHVALRTCYTMPGGPPEWPGVNERGATRGDGPQPAAVPAKEVRAAWPRMRGGLTIAAFAAVVLIVAALQFVPFNRVAPGPGEDAVRPIARLTKAVGVRWSGGAEQPVVGAELRPGKLRLADGLAELALGSGVRVVLEAPVEIELLDVGAARLQLGRIVAHVPPRGRGFAVQTPRARVVDHGTEFGIGVRDAGETEVQVFQGAVVAEWEDAAGKKIDRRLDAGKAVVIDRETQAEPKEVPYYPESFVRTFPDIDSGEPGGALYNRSRFDAVHVVPAPAEPTIDGDLSDWDRSGAFYSACLPPYHENYYLEGAMMYDEKAVYIAAHVGDPAPMRSVMDPQADPKEYPWRGGSVIVRLSVDPELGWPLQGVGRAEAERVGIPNGGRRPVDQSDKIVHLTMWYYRPAEKARLLVSYGMDFHNDRYDPDGARGAFRMDPNGRGYTLEYAIPWSALNAGKRPPRAGDVLAANWTVHWSDEEGKASRGTLVEVTNLDNQPYRFLRASTWGKAIYHDRGRLPPGTAAPKGQRAATP